jgi:hypothetical protein
LFGPVADWFRRSLTFPAYTREPNHFRLPVRERAQPGFVLVHEGPDEFNLALIRPADDLQTRNRFDLNPRVERIIEGTLEAIIIEVNGRHTPDLGGANPN